MNFETVKKNNKTKIIIGVSILLILTSVVMFVGTRAKYRSVQSLKLANGTIDYKAPDLKLAIKVSEDGENYTSRTDIPTSGYTFNTEKSKCRIPTSTQTGENAPIAEGVTIEYTDGKINVLGVTQQDTRCYVYFDKVLIQTSSTIIADIKNRTDGSYKGNTIPTFTNVATGAETEANNGIYETDDPMYGENAKTYYWRGAATTNYLIFSNFCWRIVRINGDGSIRIIYAGSTCKANGTMESKGIKQVPFALELGTGNYASHVGWTYELGYQRTLTGSNSNIKKNTEAWFNQNITDKSKIVSGMFCNDRDLQNGGRWDTMATSVYYDGYNRVNSNNPKLSCNNGDIYTLSVGAITADEVIFAGGGTSPNINFYLYSGYNYWTMTPGCFTDGAARVYYFNNTLLHTYGGANNIPYFRPVINLRSDVTFNVGSDGTQNNPYIVQ